VGPTPGSGAGRDHTGALNGDCLVLGRAADLYVAQWNRIPTDNLTVSGEAAVLQLFLDRVYICWP